MYVNINFSLPVFVLCCRGCIGCMWDRNVPIYDQLLLAILFLKFSYVAFENLRSCTDSSIRLYAFETLVMSNVFCMTPLLGMYLKSSFVPMLLFCINIQSQIQDFPKEGARFRVKCHVGAIQWGGGGVVAEFFRGLQKPMRFRGGVVAEIFRYLKKPMRFRDLKTAFFVNGALLHFFTFPKGGPGPLGPPPESATDIYILHCVILSGGTNLCILYADVIPQA